MASYYVDSSATGLADGTTKADAYTSISNALAGSAGVGDILLCSHTHDETQTGALTITCPTNSNDNPVRIISINFTGDAYTAGAKTGTTNGTNVIVTGASPGFEFYGVVFTSGNSYTIGANDACGLFYDCEIRMTGTGNAQSIGLGNNRNTQTFIKCGFSFGNAGQDVNVSGNNSAGTFQECTLLSGTSAITGFLENFAAGGNIVINGFDFSLAASTFEVIRDVEMSLPTTRVRIHGVELPSGGSSSIGDFTYPAGGTFADGVIATAIDDATDDVFMRLSGGDITDELVIYRDATFDGTTPYSLKFVSDSLTNPGSLLPGSALVFDIATFYSTANPTVTVHAFGDHATILTDQEFWIEVEYPISTGKRGSSSTVHSDFVSGTGSSVTATGSAGDWTGESGSNQRFYNPSVTVSGGSAGIHRVRVYLARASETLYVDPKVDLT